MKRLIWLFSAFSMAGPLAAGAPDSGAVERQLMQTEREWADAMMKDDPAGIERIEADDYSYFFDGVPGDKKSDLADAKGGAFAGSAELTDVKVRVFGSAAVVTGKAALRDAKYKGKDVSGNYLFTDTFVKRNGRWQVVASHSNKAPGM